MPKIAAQMIARVSSDESGGCALCNFAYTLNGTDNFADACNHLMQKHNLKCLHVGQETSRNIDDGSPWHTTVAIFGV